MFRRWTVLRVPTILLAVLIAITVPFFLSADMDLRHADAAYQRGDYSSAARDYRYAALKLPWKSDLWEQAALANIRGGDPAAAASIYESLSRQGILSAGHWEVYGALAASVGHPEEALRIWTAGLNAHPTHNHFYALISAAYKDLGDYSNQRIWLERWIATGNAGAADRFELGLLLIASDGERARAEFAKAAATDPNFDAAVQTLTATIDLGERQGDESRRLVVLGRGLGLVNRWALALTAFQQAANTDDHNAQAWAWLGEARQQMGQDGSAELSRAWALDSNDPVIAGLFALFYRRHGEYQKELGWYAAAAQLEPQNPEWQAGMADAHALNGDVISALAEYQKAAELAPEDAASWRLLAMFCADNGIQVQQVGLPAAKKAASLAPNDPAVLDALGWSYAQAGLLFNAEQNLRKAVKLDPEMALAHLHLGEMYLRKGDQAAALTEFRTASELDADGPVGALAGELIKQYAP